MFVRMASTWTSLIVGCGISQFSLESATCVGAVDYSGHGRACAGGGHEGADGVGSGPGRAERERHGVARGARKERLSSRSGPTSGDLRDTNDENLGLLIGSRVVLKNTHRT